MWYEKHVQKLQSLYESSGLSNLLVVQLELRPYLKGIPYWTGAVLVGFIAVIYSALFTDCIAFANWVYETNPKLLLILTPLCFVIVTFMVEKIAPAASGTGVPTVVQAMRLDPLTQPAGIHELLRLKVFVVVMLGSLLGVFGGGSLGREGPMVHMGACIFYFAGHLFQRYFGYEEHRSWIVAGAAAGISAAFNAPLAGIVFVLEELAQSHFHAFKSMIITAAIIGGVVSQWLSGRYLFVGFPNLGSVPLSSLPWALGLGILCGLLAFPFHRLLRDDVRVFFQKYIKTRFGIAVVSGLGVALLTIYVSPKVQGGGVALVSELLFDQSQHADWRVIVGRFFGTLLSHISGCVGGFLAPSLALGGAIGSQFADLTGYPNHNLLVMVGMSAFLSAIIGAPFTAWVIVMEITGSHAATFPLMLASLVSAGTMKGILDRKIIFLPGRKKFRK